MSYIKKKPIKDFALNFIPKNHAQNKDPYFYQNTKISKKEYRTLTKNEKDILLKNNNFVQNWDEFFVTKQFNPQLIKNSNFFGRVTIGNLSPSFLEHHDLKLPVGIYNSTIISCEIHDDVIITNVDFLSHFIISTRCILFNINEMITTDHAKFGNGILKKGENEELRIWLEICNENGKRKILPFESMIPADAYIWSKFRDDTKLMNKLKEITDNSFDKERGAYGIIEENSIIKNSRIIKDVKIGKHAYIKGANKIKNVTVLSSKESPSQIGEGVELVNGIIGYGSKIFYGSKAIRFVTGQNTQLKYGARLINSVLGDNSTVSCCEILNNLLFPFHEQHHNNSFLIASTLKGQSNIAAGATIGSNHNSRAADGEIIANRGFWPGLCTSLKHNSYFASFTLVTQGAYLYEMNIQYPFSLISLPKDENTITIMPAYWFLHNMYAINRNKYKFNKRDQRKIKSQNIELDYLAPDTISEILFAIKKLESLINQNSPTKKETLRLNNDSGTTLHDSLAMKKYGAKIIKPIQAIKKYKEIALFFAIKNIASFFALTKETTFSELQKKNKTLYAKKLHLQWKNIGGQIIPEEELKIIIKETKGNKLKSWDEIHKKYDLFWEKYSEHKTRYALYVIEEITENKIPTLSKEKWIKIINKAINTAKDIETQSISSRKKDYSDPFRKTSYQNNEEMNAVIGSLEDNSFLKVLKKETKTFVSLLKSIVKN